MRRAKREARLCHTRAAGTLHGQSNAEIGHQRGAILQQDVLRLDIAMHDPLPVRMLQRTRRFAGDTHSFLDRQLAFLRHARAERLSPDVGHDVVQQSVRGSRVEQRQNVRMLQFRRRLDLGQESLGTERRAKVGVQDLDGDVALVLEIMREIHCGHPAGPDFALDAIAVGDGGGESSPNCCHAGNMRARQRAVEPA